MIYCTPRENQKNNYQVNTTYKIEEVQGIVNITKTNSPYKKRYKEKRTRINVLHESYSEESSYFY